MHEDGRGDVRRGGDPCLEVVVVVVQRDGWVDGNVQIGGRFFSSGGGEEKNKKRGRGGKKADWTDEATFTGMQTGTGRGTSLG